MRVGVDFGTTRTIVVRVDRGNYPIVPFPDADGDLHEYFPSVIALGPDGPVFGFEAEAAGRAGAPVLRSVKRLLGDAGVSTGTTVELGQQTFLLSDLLTGFLSSLRAAVIAAVGPEDTDEELRAAVSVPAHARSAQRFLTLEAFRQAGFGVLALINEPSAAGFEFTHRRPRTLSSRRTQVVVYDLGGGTFDASVVEADGVVHDVLRSAGVNRLGGDDFDRILAATALRVAGRTEADLTAEQREQLLQDSREVKERLTPQSRRMVLEIADEPVVVAVDDFYTASADLVEESVSVLSELIGGDDTDEGLDQVAGVYLVGGGSGLPLVPRVLRERFGRRVHRSPYPAAATAIGLAIAADPESGFALTDRLSRGFGVFREGTGGRTLSFDEIFSRDDALPTSGAVTVTRRYRAVHNLGFFRYVEYGKLGADGAPDGQVVPFASTIFPFDPSLRSLTDLVDVPVVRLGDGPLVEETYSIDPGGLIEVRIDDLTTGFSRTYGLRTR